jgi:large subunit ribosomal protein L21
MLINVIVKLSGHQSFIEFGNSFDVPKINIITDKYILLKKILLISLNNKIFNIGKPYLTNILAYAKILKQNITKSKLIIFKMKSKKGYRRKKGYKSLYTKLFFVGLDK